MYSVIDSYNVDKNIIISALGVVAFKPKVANEDRNAKKKTPQIKKLHGYKKKTLSGHEETRRHDHDPSMKIRVGVHFKERYVLKAKHVESEDYHVSKGNRCD